MICFPNAKINLGLCITRRRPDGYHDLQTVFYPVQIRDALEVVEVGSCAVKCRLFRHGLKLDGDPQQDLTVRAYRLLDNLYDLPPVEVHLLKGIPSGAGLGGGSADAAFMLLMLNELFELGLAQAELERHAATLGADCAVFIANRPVYAEGIGNIFTPIQLSLKGYGIEIVKPPVFVSTREAFACITPHEPTVPLLDVIQRPVSTWHEGMINDFEASVIPQHSVIGRIKQGLYDRGALYAAMTGSGSSVFGLFPPGKDWPEALYAPDTFVWRGQLG